MSYPLLFRSPIELLRDAETTSKLLDKTSQLYAHIEQVRKLLKRAFPSRVLVFEEPAVRLLEESMDHRHSFSEFDRLMLPPTKALHGRIIHTENPRCYGRLKGHEFVLFTGDTQAGYTHLTIAYFTGACITEAELAMCYTYAQQPTVVLTPTEEHFITALTNKTSKSLSSAEQQAILFGVDLHTPVPGYPLFPLTLLSPNMMLDAEGGVSKIVSPKSPLFLHIMTTLLAADLVPPHPTGRLVVQLDPTVLCGTTSEPHRMALELQFSVYFESLNGVVIDVSDPRNYVERGGYVALRVGTIKEMTPVGECYILLKKLQSHDSFTEWRNRFSAVREF